MRADEGACPYCTSILYAHCTVFHDGPEFCDLQDRYWNDPAFGIVDVYDALSKMENIDQKQRVKAWIDTRMARGEGPVTREEAYPAIALRPRVVFEVGPAAVAFQVHPPSVRAEVPVRAVAEPTPANKAAQAWLGRGGGG